MKLLTSTSLILLFIGFTGSSYGQCFDETKLLAEQGNAFAQQSLGSICANGENMPQNNVRAYIWWSVSVCRGLRGQLKAIIHE